MKTRIIKTKFWQDSDLLIFTKNAKYLYIYLLTCPHVSLTKFFEISEKFIELETGLSKNDIKMAKKELQKAKKAFFHNSWCYVPNLEKHNRYKASPLTTKAYKDELSKIPQSVINAFRSVVFPQLDSTMDTTMHSTHNTEIINKKQEIRNKKEEQIGDDEIPWE